MQSGSALYFSFLGLIFLAYWASTVAGPRTRQGVLLFANYFFCVRFGLFYLFLLPLCSSVDFLVGLALTRFQRPALRRAMLALSVCMNLALLIGSRHALWFMTGGNQRWSWVFPLGLSFYVFQELSYAIDLYRRDGEATNSLLAYLASASFFPMLQAGPISRMCDLVKQISGKANLTREEGGRALFLIAFGLVKKFIIADYLAENLVNQVFDTPNLYSGAENLIAVLAYSVQLYYDFSGYTDIARGSAQLLGIRLPINFNRPYSSANLVEFWRRWHISFSDWLRDYLYFSLPGKRTKAMPYLNLVITMILGGLWHGIAWTFAIWGLLHGAALALTRVWQYRRRSHRSTTAWGRYVAVVLTYLFVCLTWVFFRAASVSDAMAVLSRIASVTVSFENVRPVFLCVLIAGALCQAIQKRYYTKAMEAFAGAPFYVHSAALVLVIVAIQMLAGHSSAPFVYSRF